MKSRRSWWLIYTLSAAAVAVMLLWITGLVLRLEAAERGARAEIERRESMRLALWRMDSWIAPRLAREAARPYFEYRPYYAPRRAYTSGRDELEPGAVFAPSPLLTFESDLFLLHFQRTEDGGLTSPQVPTGDWHGMPEADLLDGAELQSRRRRLEQLAPRLAAAQLDRRLDETELFLARTAVASAPQADVPGPEQPSPTRSGIEQSARLRNYQQAQSEVIAQELANPLNRPADLGEPVAVGPFVPLWLKEENGSQATPLVLVRRVRAGGESLVQGILLDWPRLREALLAEITDLLPGAQLQPMGRWEGEGAPAGRMLATIPVVLEPGGAPVVAAAGLTPARLTLLLTWLAMLIAALAVAVTLRASIAYGERRSRFASAVTHELRTPLTTFRMYSEMLVDGMVSDEGQRRAYLSTLKEESGRLATLVENVLTYARLEEGRTASRRRRMTVDEMLERVQPQLARRAEEAKMNLRVDLPNEIGDMPMETDPDAVGQILLNLVDNACKYASGAARRDIHLIARRQGGRVALSVCDHGPGIDPGFRRRLFVAFRRAEHAGDDAAGGVGLGLALARALARDLGGGLILDSTPPLAADDVGACFTLTLPLKGD
ncbi:MAG: HAMP domain-containing sensor histidine kinase [Planctomycetota bacterium]|nr:HAMP domain-containing sensor histidine kinase [Planctomycetota bacterium]